MKLTLGIIIRFSFLILLSTVFYCIGKPSLFFYDGLPSFFRYLSPFIEITGLVLLFHLLNSATNKWQRILFCYLFLLGITLFVFHGYWLGIERLTGFGPWKVAVLSFFLSCLLYPHFFIFTLFFNKLKNQSALIMFISLFIFSLWEWFIPGIDTIHTGQTWIELAPHLTLAPILGLPVYTLFNYGLSWWIFIKGLKWIHVFVVLAFILINLNFEDSIKTGPEIRIIQTAHLPFPFLKKEFGKEKALDIIAKSVGENFSSYTKKPALIILPETTWPFPLSSNLSLESQISTTFPFIAPVLDDGVLVGMGAPTIGKHDKFERYYNSFWLMERNQPDQIYHKGNLMPLAEAPLSLIGEDLTAQIMSRKDFIEAGTDFSSLILPSGEKFQVDICFDGDSPFKLRNKLIKSDGADFLVNIANDYWFNPSSQAEVHLWRSRWTTVLFSLPMARSTNDGVSAFVGWDGVVDEKLPAWKSGYLQSQLRYKKNKYNIFLRFGLIPFILISSFIALGIYLYDRRYKNR